MGDSFELHQRCTKSVGCDDEVDLILKTRQETKNYCKSVERHIYVRGSATLAQYDVVIS
jgi:hypothetical protein